MDLCSECGTPRGQDDKFCRGCGASVSDVDQQNDPLVGKRIGDKYIVREVIGVGGMGRVYRAEQTNLDRTVAVKVVHPHLLSDETIVARFYTEARASSRLNHPNSVSVFDFGRTNEGQLYLVMEYLEGYDLAHVIENDGPLDYERTCVIALGILDALSEAHKLQIIHRDLKPENILIRTLNSGRDLIKVVDFGLATLVNAKAPSVTQPGLICGTPDYMSPEQVRGDELDHRSDLYALGVMLFELLADQLPFDGETSSRVALAHVQEPVPDPRVVAPYRKIPDALAEIAMRAMAKTVDDRFSDAGQMQIALRDVLRGLQERQKVAMVQCPSCTAENPVGQFFCGVCGSLMKTPTLAKATTSKSSFRPVLARYGDFHQRQDELKECSRIRESTRSGMRWLQIVGEAGVGKSRFLKEVAERYATEGDLVVGASAHPTGTMVPYHQTKELIEQLSKKSLAELHNDYDDDDALAAAGLHEIEKPQGLACRAGERSRAPAVGYLLRKVLVEAAKRASSKRVVFMLDDYTEYDGLSQLAIQAISPTETDPAVLILVTTENARDASSGTSEQIRLKPFAFSSRKVFEQAYPDLKNVAYNQLPPKATPLFLERLSQWHDGKPPERIADTFMLQIGALNQEELRALQVLAVLGNRVKISDFVTMAGSEAYEALATIEGQELVTVSENEITIIHPLVRRVVEESIPAEVRRELHGQALELAIDNDAPLVLRAHHGARSGQLMVALTVLERWGNQCLESDDAKGAREAYSRGLAIARKALLEEHAEFMTDAVVMFSTKLAETALLAGDHALADGLVREVVDLTSPVSRGRMKLIFCMARSAKQRGRAWDAVRYFDEAIGLAKEADPSSLGRIYWEYADMKKAGGDSQAAWSLIEEALHSNPSGTEGFQIELDALEVLLKLDRLQLIPERQKSLEEKVAALNSPELNSRFHNLLAALEERQSKRRDAHTQLQQALGAAADAGDVRQFERISRRIEELSHRSSQRKSLI